MNTLEISLIGSACGKNVHEPKNKTIMLLLCRHSPKIFKEKLIKNGNIRPLEGISLKKPIEESYKTFSKIVVDPIEFADIEKKVIQDIKTKTPGISNDEIETVKGVIRDSLKKDCGKNVEDNVIHKSKYTKGNNKMWYYTDPNKKWNLKGFHDATDGDLVIEIKTRMKLQNVRKNEYDLYQLFGYLLVMGKTRGLITQTFSGKVFNSYVETENEYGIIDITEEKWNDKYITFYKDLCSFFEDVNKFINEDNFDISSVMKKDKIYAEYDTDGRFHNIDPKFTNIFKAIC